MKYNGLAKFFILFFILLTELLNAQTLKNVLLETLNSNPVVLEKLREYREYDQRVNVYKSELLPKLDISTSYNYNHSNDFVDNTDIFGNILVENSFDTYRASITLTQNIFNGFKTTNSIDFAKAQSFVKAYKYIDEVNRVSFEVVKNYIELFKTTELLKVRLKNLSMQKSILNRFDNEEVKYIIAKNKVKLADELIKVREAKFRYRELLGRMPNLKQLKKLDFNIRIPSSVELAQLYALRHNADILASEFNIKALKFEKKSLKGNLLPKVDIRLTQYYQDVTSTNLYDQPDDRFEASIVLTYNIFSGFKDNSAIKMQMSKIAKAIEQTRYIKRKIIKNIDSAWDRYESVKYKKRYLKEYKKLVENAYNKNKTSSFKTRLALLQDLFNSQYSLIESKYDELLYRYEILHNMGLLVPTVLGSSKRYLKLVNLYKNLEHKTVIDKDFVLKDMDKDRVDDIKDLCDNSKSYFEIGVFGCKNIDSFKDNMQVLEKIKFNQKNYSKKVKTEAKKRKKSRKVKKKRVIKKRKKSIKKQIIQTPALIVNSVNEDYLKNSFIQENLIQNHRMVGDGFDNGLFEVEEDLDNLACVNVPSGYKLDKNGCAVSLTLQIPSKFEKLNSKLPPKLEEKIIELAAFLNRNPDLNVDIVGYSSRTKRSNKWYNIKLSKQRADRMKNELVKRGVFAFRITTDGKGFANPIASNATKDGRDKNRRLEIKFLRK